MVRSRRSTAAVPRRLRRERPHPARRHPRHASRRRAADRALAIATFEEIVALAAEKRDLQVKMALERDVRLVRCEDGKLEIALESAAGKTLVNELSRKIGQWTGRPWMVIVSAGPVRRR